MEGDGLQPALITSLLEQEEIQETSTDTAIDVVRGDRERLQLRLRDQLATKTVCVLAET